VTIRRSPEGDRKGKGRGAFGRGGPDSRGEFRENEPVPRLGTLTGTMRRPSNKHGHGSAFPRHDPSGRTHSDFQYARSVA